MEISVFNPIFSKFCMIGCVFILLLNDCVLVVVVGALFISLGIDFDILRLVAELG